jgi:SAM-dependent methyltransferase/uncharacterized protein YbaR (Trm112 family)
MTPFGATDQGEMSQVNSDRNLLVCPACRSGLTWSAEAARCVACSSRFPVEQGIPLLVTDAALADHDEGIHHATESSKRRQASFFDSVSTQDFEIDRPHGSAKLYAWMLGEKARRSVIGFQEVLAGMTALTVCGGSGMDAEGLARRGARVISSDLSLGAATRAAERARRRGLAFASVVADVERLPFQDESVDLVYVHDGLHHLEDPVIGLREMARVAKGWISVNEPAQAKITQLATRLGIAKENEKAGNRVGRLRQTDVVSVLKECGFDVVEVRRYAMYYQHQPGRLGEILSRPGLFQGSRAVWQVFNTLMGGLGNKLTVQGVRSDGHNKP